MTTPKNGALCSSETLLQDVRYGFRNLRKSPGFAVVAVLTLALGTGATTAIFSVLDTVVLQPLPYPHPEQRSLVWNLLRRQRGCDSPRLPAPEDYFIFREQGRTFAGCWHVLSNQTPTATST